MDKIKSILLSINGLAASIGAIVPGYAFFIDYAPPFFKSIGLITSALGVFVMIICSNSKGKPSKMKASGLAFIAAVLILGYIALLKLTTVEIDGQRHQIGFYLSEISLTSNGSAMLSTKLCPQSTPKEIITFCISGETEQKIEKIWKVEFIVIVGLINITVFILASLFWVASFVWLARYSRNI